METVYGSIRPSSMGHTCSCQRAVQYLAYNYLTKYLNSRTETSPLHFNIQRNANPFSGSTNILCVPGHLSRVSNMDNNIQVVVPVRDQN
jgi:hypothetical protein